ncbi:MAG: hypothetical protein QXX17_02405 [Conexivisphaerales archaeon]
MKGHLSFICLLGLLALSIGLGMFNTSIAGAATAQPSLFVTVKQTAINSGGFEDSTTSVSLPGGSSIVSLVDGLAPTVSPAFFAINFTGITFQAAQFYLLLSTNGLAQRSAGDIQFAGPFNVADLSSAPKNVNGYYIGFANGTSYISGPVASGEAGGTYYIKVWSGTSSPVLVSLQKVIILPATKLSPTLGPAGESIVLTGFGFTPNGTVTIKLQNSTSAPIKTFYAKNITASQNGNFTWSSANDSSFTIPDYGKISNTSPVVQPEGTIYVVAKDVASNTQAAPQPYTEQYREFTSILAYNPNSKTYVTPSGSGPYGNDVFITVYIGSFLNVTGNYFNPARPLSFFLNSSSLQPVFVQQVNGSGYFVADFRIPIVKLGIYLLRFSDSTGNMSIVLEVRAVAVPSVAIKMSYSVIGGGSGYSAPTLNYVAYGIPQSVTLSSSPTTYYMDYGSTWNVSSSLAGSTSSEAWRTNQATTGIATSNTSISFTYYHQYAVEFTYTAKPSGSLNPAVTYLQFGINKTTATGISVWADAGSSCQFVNPIAISSNERYYSPDSSFNVNSSGNIQAVYYHQYQVSFPYTITGGGNGYQAPVVNYVALGINSTASAGNLVWADAGSQYAYPSILPGSSSAERWIAQNPSLLNGLINSPLMQPVVYVHQYYVTITASTPQAGSVSPSSGWFNAGSVISISASVNQGYSFSSWTGSGTGSFSGASATSSITVSSSITESAAFNVQLLIKSSGAGSVAYAYGSNSGTIHGQGTLYLPVGSTVKLSASPSSFLYSFLGWSGASNSTSSSIDLAVSQPSSITASFSYNYLSVSAIAIVVIAAAILLFLFIRRVMR